MGTRIYTFEITVGDAPGSNSWEWFFTHFFYLFGVIVEFKTIVKLQEVFLTSKNTSPAFLMEFKDYQDGDMTKT
jgi:hypothetical protein